MCLGLRAQRVRFLRVFLGIALGDCESAQAVGETLGKVVLAVSRIRPHHGTDGAQYATERAAFAPPCWQDPSNNIGKFPPGFLGAPRALPCDCGPIGKFREQRMRDHTDEKQDGKTRKAVA
jgi:hypothetical protein